MSIWDSLKQRLSPRFSRVIATRARQSIDSDQTSLMGQIGGGLSILSAFSPDDYWRNTKLDANTLDKVSPARLIELLADCSPDVSRALWDFLLFMCPGWEVLCYKPGTKDQDPAAKAKLLEFFNQLHGPFATNHKVPLEVVFASMFMGLFLRGALFAELVLDAEGRMPLEIATPDPATVRARVKRDAERKYVWEIGQFQLGQFIVLDRPTVFYLPLHPLPGRPYGRSLAAPAVFSTLFLLGLLHDLRRVVAQQGYPRLDIMIDFTKLKPPADAASGSQKEQDWVRAVTKQVTDYYAQLQPDSAFVHSDAVTINKNTVGTLDASSLGKLDDLIKMIERMSVRGLKSMTVLFSINDASTETMVHRQWRIYVAGIKSLQHLAENLMNQLCSIALQVQGITADVVFKFAELLASDEFIDAQTRILNLTAANMAYDAGIISQDERAQFAWQKDKADMPNPRVSAQQGNVNAQTLPSIDDNKKATAAIKRLLQSTVSQSSNNGNGNSHTTIKDDLLVDFTAWMDARANSGNIGENNHDSR